jgi:pimeloyl-ACP methyl ester carboxylesterase
MSQKRSCCAAWSSPAPGPRADAPCRFGARKSVLTPSRCPGRRDVYYLSFAPTETSQAKGKEFVGRIFTREQDRGQIPALAVRDVQPEAIPDWGIPDISKLARPAGITQRTLVANGDNDILVPTINSYLLNGHIPNAELIIYPDADHGFLFQYPHQFAAEVSKFLTDA